MPFFTSGMNKKIGFTLLELLVVISIIALFAAILISAIGDTRAKGQRAGVVSDAMSVIPELSLCANENVDPSAPVAGDVICLGGSATWPEVKSGWAYGTGADAPTGTVLGGSYVFYLTKSGQTRISCLYSESACH